MKYLKIYEKFDFEDFDEEEFNDKEKVDFSILWNELEEYPNFTWDNESDIGIMFTYLSDVVDHNNRFDPHHSIPETKNWKLVDASREKGNGKDESTITAIFLRKSDNKKFSMWIHDAGFYGPSTLTMSDKLIEIN